MNDSLSPFAPENFWSRETGSAVPSRVSLPSPYSRLNLKLAYGISPEYRCGVHSLSIHTEVHICVHTMCVCVCVFSSLSFWTSSSLDVPAGVTQEEGHTGFLIHLLSAVRALIFLARRIQPFLSLDDREVEFCVLTI